MMNEQLQPGQEEQQAARNKYIKMLEAGFRASSERKKQLEANGQACQLLLQYLKYPMKHNLSHIAQQIQRTHAHYMDKESKDNLTKIYKAILKDCPCLIETELGGKKID